MSKVLKYVEQGEEVLITRRKSVVAKIVPPDIVERAELPRFFERAQKNFGKIKGKSPSEIILEDREERV